jgi:hypothetical protein
MPVTAQADQLVISIEHAPDGSWCDMWDNQVIGWTDDPAPQPMIVGGLPPASATTDPPSPQWVSVIGDFAIVPNLWRGNLPDLFDWLSGGTRKLRGTFLFEGPLNAYANWAQDNPTLVWPGPS